MGKNIEKQTYQKGISLLYNTFLNSFLFYFVFFFPVLFSALIFMSFLFHLIFCFILVVVCFFFFCKCQCLFMYIKHYTLIFWKCPFFIVFSVVLLVVVCLFGACWAMALPTKKKKTKWREEGVNKNGEEKKRERERRGGDGRDGGAANCKSSKTGKNISKQQQKPNRNPSNPTQKCTIYTFLHPFLNGTTTTTINFYVFGQTKPIWLSFNFFFLVYWIKTE